METDGGMRDKMPFFREGERAPMVAQIKANSRGRW